MCSFHKDIPGLLEQTETGKGGPLPRTEGPSKHTDLDGSLARGESAASEDSRDCGDIIFKEK